jgi:hypothetical protein
MIVMIIMIAMIVFGILISIIIIIFIIIVSYFLISIVFVKTVAECRRLNVKASRKINPDQESAIDALKFEAVVAAVALPSKVEAAEAAIVAIRTKAIEFDPVRIASSKEKKGVADLEETKTIAAMREQYPAVFERANTYSILQLKSICAHTKDEIKNKQTKKSGIWATISQCGRKDILIGRLIYRAQITSAEDLDHRLLRSALIPPAS